MHLEESENESRKGNVMAFLLLLSVSFTTDQPKSICPHALMHYFLDEGCNITDWTDFFFSFPTQVTRINIAMW